jgi:hypothetical protein
MIYSRGRVHMAKLTIALTTVSKVVVIVLLTAGNGLAISKYAQKYGISCKSCHPSGSELNELGKKFWKNGHSFGDNNTEQLEKLKQSAAGEDKKKAAETVGKNSVEPSAVASRNEGIVSEPVEQSEAVKQPLPETRIYRWKNNDGTWHFSDSPSVNSERDSKSASGKVVKKITQPRFRQLPKTSKKAVVPRHDKSALPKPDPVREPESTRIAKKPDVGNIGFEGCLEEALVSMQHPETPDAAMEQFLVAEDVCASWKK